jgi:hypothetical protein
VRTILSQFSPVGTAESSPGRESWVEFEKRPSPAGTAENTPGCNPGEPPALESTISDSGQQTQDHVLGNFQPELSKLGEDAVFRRCILLKRLKRVGAHEIRLPEDFRSTIHQQQRCMEAQTLTLSSRAKPRGPAVRLDAKQRPAVLGQCTPGKLFSRESCLGRRNRLVKTCELTGRPLFDVKAHSRSLGFARDDKVQVCASMQCCR